MTIRRDPLSLSVQRARSPPDKRKCPSLTAIGRDAGSGKLETPRRRNRQTEPLSFCNSGPPLVMVPCPDLFGACRNSNLTHQIHKQPDNTRTISGSHLEARFGLYPDSAIPSSGCFRDKAPIPFPTYVVCCLHFNLLHFFSLSSFFSLGPTIPRSLRSYLGNSDYAHGSHQHCKP